MEEFHKPKEDFLDTRWNFFSWAEVADDYKMTVDALGISFSVARTIEFLSEINKAVAKESKYIFDGTISSLRFLYTKGLLDVENLSENDLIDAKYLQEFVKKYLTNNPPDNLAVSKNRWSTIALKCKAITIGLFLNSGKIQVSSKARHAIDFLSELNEKDFPLHDDDAKNGKIHPESMKRLSMLNSMWIGLITSSPVYQNQGMSLGEIVILDCCFPTEELEFVFNQVDPIVNEISKECFPDFGRGHIVFFAVRHALTISIYNAIDKMPDGVNAHPNFRSDGMRGRVINYIFEEDFQLQPWFREYLYCEMRKHIKLIEILAKTKNAYVDMQGHTHLKYIPFLDSFRFMSPNELSYYRIVLPEILSRKDFQIEDKDKILRSITRNLQKIVVYQNSLPKNFKLDPTEQEEFKAREVISELLLDLFEPLRKTTGRKYSGYYENNDSLFDEISTELILAFLTYDESKYPRLLGYLKGKLNFKIKDLLYEKKVYRQMVPLEGIALEANINIEKEIDESIEKERMFKFISTLSKKEKEAIEKAYFRNEKLTEAERKAKNRGIQRIKKTSDKH